MVVTGAGLRFQIGRSIKIEPFRDKNFKRDSYDLTLGDEFMKLKSEDMSIIDPMSLDVVGERTKSRDFTLKPDGFVLARSEEWVTLDNQTLALVSGKSSLARLGLQIESAAILHPGHEGYIILEIKNNNSVPFRLVKGMKIAQLIFFKTSDPVKEYVKRKTSTFKVQRAIELPNKLSFSD